MMGDSDNSEISSVDALIHLAISREVNSHLDFEKKFNLYKNEPLDVLEEKALLKPAPDRFKQCYTDTDTKRFLVDVPVDKIFNKYFPGTKWPISRDFIINFAYNFYDDDKVLAIKKFSINPRISVIKLLDEKTYNILDGIHRIIAYIKDGRDKIPAVVINVKYDFL